VIPKRLKLRKDGITERVKTESEVEMLRERVLWGFSDTEQCKHMKKKENGSSQKLGKDNEWSKHVKTAIFR
jgi:hypothetical protein